MSKKQKKTGAEGVKWNLADLYKGMNDPKINSDLKNIYNKTKQFEKKYKGKIKSTKLTGPLLLKIVRELENINQRCGRILSFAHLMFAADTSDPKIGAFLQSVQDSITQIRKKLLFFDVEWATISDKRANKFINNPRLSNYKHFLIQERKYKPHTLSEGEEQIMAEKANTSSRAFSRLFDEILNNIEFEVRIKGKIQKLSESEVLALSYDPNRKTRMAASKGLTQGLKDNSHTLTFIFNTLVNDHTINDRIRSFSNPMSSRHLSNEISDKTVNALMDSCEKNYDIVDQYYQLKKKLTGIRKFYDYDRYAPVIDDNNEFTFNEAKNIILRSFYNFSPKMAEIANKFFKLNWIDAELRDGKRGGAFSHSTVPGVHPYVFMNYTGKTRDVMTLAHELGHGIHQYLSRKQGYFQCHTPLTTAETASVFAEMIVFHSLLESRLGNEERLALICSKLEDIFATVFRQVVLTRFEQILHDLRRSKGELTTEEINKIWIETNRQMYGDSVILTEEYSYWWLYIPHFIHSPFYCYAYSFGELLVLALYKIYQEQGNKFVPKYLKLLSAGGSEPPDELVKTVGVDINDPWFWQSGLELIREMTNNAIELAK